MNEPINFIAVMPKVAQKHWGVPNDRLSKDHVLRWGSRGSRKVDMEAGTWYDFEHRAGGGVFEL